MTLRERLSKAKSALIPGADEGLRARLIKQGCHIFVGEDGERLFETLNKIVHPEERETIYKQIDATSTLAKEIRRQRGIHTTSSTDSLALIRLLVELRTENMPVTADYRPENGTAFHAKDKFQVKPEIIFAAVLYSAFPINRQSGEINLDDAANIRSYFGGIKGIKLDEECETHVLRILRDALMASEINLGGAVSPAYQEIDGRRPTDEEAVKLEAQRIERFHDILPALDICPEAILLRSLSNSLGVDDMIANPQAYGKRDVEQAAKALDDIYIPMDARARHRAYNEGDVSTANLLNILKTKFKNQRLRLIAPKEYELTRQAILDYIREIAPEDKRPHIVDMPSARAFAFKAIGGEIFPLFSEAVRRRLRVIVRLKDEDSTYREIHKIHADLLKKNDPAALTIPNPSYRDMLRAYFPRINDLFGFRLVVLGAEDGAKAIREIYAAFRQKIKVKRIKNIIPVEGRMRDLYHDKTRIKFHEERGREDRGYKSLHDTVDVVVNGKPCRTELQFVDEETDLDNTFGDPAHDNYKEQMKLGKNGGPRDYVPVFTDINAIIPVPPGGSVADSIAVTYGYSEIDPYRVFAIKMVDLRRTLHHYNSSIAAPTPQKPLEGEDERVFRFRRFSERVVANDHILLWEMDPELINKPEHRKLMIAACTADETRKLLERLDAELSGAIEPPNRTARPQAGRTTPSSTHEP